MRTTAGGSSLMVVPGLLASLCAAPASAGLTERRLKNDRFNEEPELAVEEIEGETLECAAGFALGEAYGALFEPCPDDYPFDVVGVDILQLDAGEASDDVNNVTIRIWQQDDASLDAPPGGPNREFNITDCVDPGTLEPIPGVVENTYITCGLDKSDKELAPLPVGSGFVRLEIEFNDEWQPYDACSPYSCQDPCPAEDDDPPVMERNFVVSPDVGGVAWNEDLGINADWILRVVIRTENDSCGDEGESEAEAEAEAESEAEAEAESEGEGCIDADGDVVGVGLAAACAGAGTCSQVCQSDFTWGPCECTQGGDEGGGCGCAVGARPAGAGALALLLFGAIAVRGRKRHA